MRPVMKLYSHIQYTLYNIFGAVSTVMCVIRKNFKKETWNDSFLFYAIATDTEWQRSRVSSINYWELKMKQNINLEK